MMPTEIEYWNRGYPHPSNGDSCVMCGEDRAPYSPPPAFNGSLDARTNVRLCEWDYWRFVRHCWQFYGRTFSMKDTGFGWNEKYVAAFDRGLSRPPTT